MPAKATEQCHAMQRTELHGDVVVWGSDHIVQDASACCDACRAHTGRPGKPDCTVWVFCEHEQCKGQRGQCWLKHLADPFTDIDLVQGRSDRWTSGTLLPPPPGGQSGRGNVSVAEAHLALVTEHGRIRIRLRQRSPKAKDWVEKVLARHPECDGCTFYRAEAVPAHWGSLSWPDTYEGGRWGPP